MGFSAAYTTKRPALGVPFKKAKEKILGTAYDLSVAFVSPQKMRALNRRCRGIDASTDILSFALSEQTGELYISLPDAAKKSKAFGMSPRGYLGFLFIHGLLHLKRMNHGRRMEAAERKFCALFGFSAPR